MIVYYIEDRFDVHRGTRTATHTLQLVSATVVRETKYQYRIDPDSIKVVLGGWTQPRKYVWKKDGVFLEYGQALEAILYKLECRKAYLLGELRELDRDLKKGREQRDRE
jgi:hypothetical protein